MLRSHFLRGFIRSRHKNSISCRSKKIEFFSYTQECVCMRETKYRTTLAIETFSRTEFRRERTRRAATVSEVTLAAASVTSACRVYRVSRSCRRASLLRGGISSWGLSRGTDLSQVLVSRANCGPTCRRLVTWCLEMR